MKVDIISIGNSKGIRIPKVLLDQCGFDKSVDISFDKKRLVLSNTFKELRKGWDKSFSTMAARRDDASADTTFTHFDENDWQW